MHYTVIKILLLKFLCTICMLFCFYKSCLVKNSEKQIWPNPVQVPSTTGSIRSTTLPAATAPTTPTPTGGALCCYPGCNAGDRTCHLDQDQSSGVTLTGKQSGKVHSCLILG